MSKSTAPARRRRAIVAGAAGMALLLGGTTFALWEDTITLPGGNTVSSGIMELGQPGAVTYLDVTANRRDATAQSAVSGRDGHTIDLSQWQTVPGDLAEIAIPISVGLKGDNLVADLKITGTQALQQSSSWAGLKLGYELYRAGNQTPLYTSSTTNPARVLIQPQDNASGGQDDYVSANGDIVLFAPGNASQSTADYYAVILVEFDDATDGTDDQDLTEALATLGATLEQVVDTTGAGDYS